MKAHKAMNPDDDDISFDVFKRHLVSMFDYEIEAELEKLENAIKTASENTDMLCRGLP
jgi:hypothetical protein